MKASSFAVCGFAAVLSGTAVASYSTTPNAAVSFAGANLDAVVVGSSGISNANMEVAFNATEDVEIGLKAIERFIGDLPTTGASSDVYNAPIGDGDPGLARWNYVWVADFGSRSISEFDVQFDVDFDPGFGSQDFVTIDVDFQAVLFGQGGLSSTGDSQNLGFGFWAGLGASGFDPNAVGEYDIVLSVFDKSTGAEIAVSDITVVVPTPGAASIAFIGGIAALRRRR